MWLKNRSQTDNPATTQKIRRKLKKKILFSHLNSKMKQIWKLWIDLPRSVSSGNIIVNSPTKKSYKENEDSPRVFDKLTCCKELIPLKNR